MLVGLVKLDGIRGLYFILHPFVVGWDVVGTVGDEEDFWRDYR
jgi:hypothetical protein